MNEIIPGQTISHYRITEKLGQGGMGIVYKAEDTKLHRIVALKFLPPSFSTDEEAKSRFIHEAQSASALDHNNICNIHEIGETENGQLFISMAFYEGETLKDKIAKGLIGINEAIKITLQICEGLEKAHKNEIVHRDIKPANIFITDDGIVKILDFGLAKAKGQTQLTKMESTLGTVDYMSPEQANGKVVDKRTDIWAVGVVLYEMLTGKRPFAAEYEQAVIYSILNKEPDLSEVPKELSPIIKKAADKSADQRYQNLKEMIIDLESLGDEPRSKIHYLPRKLTKFKHIKILQIFIILMIVISAGIYYFYFHRSHQTLPLKRTQLTFTGNVIRAEISPDGKSIAYVDDSLRIFIRDINNTKPNEVLQSHHFKHINDLKWAPDCTKLALSTYENIGGGDIIVINRFGNIVQKISTPIKYRTISWSPDGLSLAGLPVATPKLGLINLSTSKVNRTLIFNNYLKYGFGVDWSPKGNLIAALTLDSIYVHQRLLTMSLNDNHQNIVMKDSIIGVFRWNNQGNAIYYTRGENQNLDLMKISIDPLEGKFAGGPKLVKNDLQLYGLSFSNDNKHLIGIWGQKHIELYSGIVERNLSEKISNGRRILSGTFAIISLKISPNGKSVAFSKEGQDGHDLFVMSIQGEGMTQLTFGDNVLNIAWSPDGKQIAYISVKNGTPTVCIINSSGGEIKYLMKNKVPGVGQISWAPGQFILCQATGARNFYVYDPKRESERLLVSNESVGFIFSPKFSNDGKKIAVLWNRGPNNKSGVWILSPNDTSKKYITSIYGFPVCWSEDSNEIIVYDFYHNSYEKIFANTGRHEKLSILNDKDLIMQDMDLRNKKIVWAKAQRISDAFLIDNFDPEVE